ncbi:MAG: hypothetical protein OMOMHJEC_00868 [Xanthomonadales bacterium]|nr:hypothetical protein [Xanthomonadales bacterium]
MPPQSSSRRYRETYPVQYPQYSDLLDEYPHKAPNPGSGFDSKVDQRTQGNSAPRKRTRAGANLSRQEIRFLRKQRCSTDRGSWTDFFYKGSAHCRRPLRLPECQAIGGLRFRLQYQNQARPRSTPSVLPVLYTHFHAPSGTKWNLRYRNLPPEYRSHPTPTMSRFWLPGAAPPPKRPDPHSHCRGPTTGRFGPNESFQPFLSSQACANLNRHALRTTLDHVPASPCPQACTSGRKSDADPCVRKGFDTSSPLSALGVHEREILSETSNLHSELSDVDSQVSLHNRRAFEQPRRVDSEPFSTHRADPGHKEEKKRFQSMRRPNEVNNRRLRNTRAQTR